MTAHRYKSPDDLHTFFVEEENTEYLLCDACTADAWEGDDDGEVALIRPSAELTAASMSRWMVSEEGYAHACQGHDHLMCKHVHLRLWIGAIIPHLAPATP